MRLAALQKTTLIDFPGKVAALLFTQGCNFHCPYCHNPALVPALGTEELAAGELTGFLDQRQARLQGVVISGGEPTLQPDLPAFCEALKKRGLAVKLDTNGSHPDVLRELFRENLLDYVAMDVKADPLAYPEALCSARQGKAIAESMACLRASRVPHEFRIPCAAPFISHGSFARILACAGDSPVYLQAIRLERVLRPEYFSGEGSPLGPDEIRVLQQQADAAGKNCIIR